LVWCVVEDASPVPGPVVPEEETMSKLIPMRGSRPLRALGSVVVAAVLSGDLAAAEPPSRDWHPRHRLPPRGQFFGVPALPSPIPVPFPIPFPLPLPPELAERGVTVTGPTDRCLVIVPPSIDPRFVKTAATSIDPGIFAEPRVQGLAIRPPGWRTGR
jgi:hypothetical protein